MKELQVYLFVLVIGAGLIFYANFQPTTTGFAAYGGKGEPPTVRINSPGIDQIITSYETIDVTAQDDKKVTKVEIYANGTLLVTDTSTPYQYVWNTRKWNSGVYNLVAKAYDNEGNIANSKPIRVEILNGRNSSNSIPFVNIGSPLPGEYVSGNVPIIVAASDTDGIARVEFYLEDLLIGIDSLASNETGFSFNWNSLNAINGWHSLKVMAFDSKNKKAEDTVRVFIRN